jgi:tetratricopeptide (TPR) repeat protein
VEKLVAAVTSFGADVLSPVHGTPQNGQVTDPGYLLVTTPELVARAHAAGIKVVPWTVNDPTTMASLLDAGVDGLITDCPGTGSALLAERACHFPPPTTTRQPCRGSGLQQAELVGRACCPPAGSASQSRRIRLGGRRRGRVRRRMDDGRARRRWMLPAVGFVVAGAGGGAAAASSGAGALLAGLGGAASGVGGVAGGLLLSVVLERRAADRVRAEACSRGAAAGLVLPPLRAPRSGVVGSSWLLSPDNQIAPFRGRIDELNALGEWADDPSGPALLLVIGAAGVGKSRLLVEFARREAGRWRVLRVRQGRESGLVELLLACGEPAIVVIDLKHPRPGLATLLADVQAQEGRVKVVVECRSDSWQSVLRRDLDDADVDLLDRAARLEVGAIGSTDDLLRWLNEGLAAVRQVTGLPARTVVLHGPAAGTSLLALQAQVLDLALGDSANGQHVRSEDGQPYLASVGVALLQHEQRSWRLSGTEAGDPEIARRAVCLLTVLGAADEDEAAEVLRRVPDLQDAAEERRRGLARWIRGLYPGEGDDQWVAVLEPDVLAHALCADVLGGDPRLQRRLADPQLPLPQVHRVLQVLVPGTALFPTLGPLVQAILDASPLRALPHSLAVALYSQVSPSVDSLLAEYIRRAQPRDGLLDFLQDLVSDRLLEVAAAVAEIRVDVARENGRLPALASALEHLSGSLHRLGCYGDSLAAIEEAVEIHRQLAADDPAHSPNLAFALNDLGVELDRVGRPAESLAATEQAIEIYRQLAANDPAAHRAKLALALQNLSVQLGRVGRLADCLAPAEEAVEVYRQLATDNRAVHRLGLAMALQNLYVVLEQLGRHPDGLAAAEGAVEIYRQLAADNITVNPLVLASAMEKVSIARGRLGHYTQAAAFAEGAVEIYRQLAADNPRTHRPDLAFALQNLGVTLEQAGRREDALVAYREAVRLFEDAAPDLHAVQAGAHTQARNLLRNLLLALGRTDEITDL